MECLNDFLLGNSEDKFFEVCDKLREYLKLEWETLLGAF